MRAAGLLAAPAPKALYSGFLRPPALSLAFRPCEIRCWLQTDMQPPEYDVCFAPRSGHSEAHAGLPLVTHSGLSVLYGGEDRQSKLGDAFARAVLGIEP